MRRFIHKTGDGTIDQVLESLRVPGKGPGLPPGFSEVTDDPVPAGLPDWNAAAGRRMRANGTLFPAPVVPVVPSLGDRMTDILGRLDRAGIT